MAVSLTLRFALPATRSGERRLLIRLHDSLSLRALRSARCLSISVRTPHSLDNVTGSSWETNSAQNRRPQINHLPFLSCPFSFSPETSTDHSLHYLSVAARVYGRMDI